MKAIIIVVLAVLVALCSCQPPQTATEQQNSNDISTLNYALTLEHLEATFYTEGLAKFNDSDFVNAGYDASVRSYINLIRSQEVAHVNLLTAVINGEGAAAVRPCVYNFNASLTSVQNFIATARLLEATGTSAYEGAANTINNGAYLQVAATILTVEARHTAYLNELSNVTPFPDSFNPALSPEEVVVAANDFFVRCPDPLVLPVFAFIFVPLSYNISYINASGQPETSEQFENDNDVLNYALTLELLGNYFYNTAAAMYNQTDFTNAGYSAVYPYFMMIVQHENAHVAFLQQTLASRGATVAQSCNYNLGNAFSSVSNVLAFARMLENLEVTAYDGSVNSLTQYNLIQGAASIAAVEARHAQYLNAVVLNQPVEQAFLDTANTPAQILNLTSSFFGAGCVAPVLPVQAYTLQEFGTTAYVQPAPTPSPSPAYCPPTPTPSPSTCAQPSPSPCGCGNNNNNNDGVTINFYFADMLNGL